MVILNTVNATATLDTSGSTESADLAEPIKVSMVSHANATLASLLMLVETVFNLTSNLPATKTKDTTQLLKLAFVFLVLNMLEENVFSSQLVPPTLTITVSPVSATLASNSKTVNALASMLLYQAALPTLTSMVFLALAMSAFIKLQPMDVLLALQVLHGMETLVELNLPKLVQMVTSSIPTQVNVNPQLLHAETTPTSTEPAAFVSQDLT